MRAIKFRAWDGEHKTMSDWEEIALIDLDGLNSREMVSEIWRELGNQRVLMQFTGLLDKNGKEIYESDIILIPNLEVVPITDEGQGPLEPNNKIVEVSWVKGNWGTKLGHWFQMEDEYDMENAEVIGNIYENPELLK